LVTAGVLLLLRHLRTDGRSALAASAVVLAVAVYVRPVGFAGVLAVAVILAWRRNRWANLAIFTGIFTALIAPWFVRNYVEAGYAGFSSVGEYNLLSYEAAGVYAATHGLATKTARREVNREYRQRLNDPQLSAHSSAGAALEKQMAREIILSHPVTFLSTHMRTSLVVFLPASTGLLEGWGLTSGNKGTLSVLQGRGVGAALQHYFGSNHLLLLLVLPEIILLAVQYIGIAIWILDHRWPQKRRWGAEGGLVILSILAFGFVAGPASVPRYRLPIETLLNAAGGAGLAVLFRNRRSDPADPSLMS
jgi:hypothetical protein